MISYRAETSMASLLQQKLARPDDARILLRQIYNTEVDHGARSGGEGSHHPHTPSHQAAHDQAVHYLCRELNATNTLFPDSDLRLIY